MKFYHDDVHTIITALATNSTHGLSSQEARKRLVSLGPNSLPKASTDSWIRVFIRQFQSPLIYLLLSAALLIFFIGDDGYDAFVISGVLFFNALVGTVQEGRARSILDSLNSFIKTTSVVLRDGKECVVDDTQLVPGDIVLVQDGYKIPADARIIEAHLVSVNEATLTGESEPVQKTAQSLDADLPLYAQKNMLFCGTYVISGSAKAVVVATGTSTEIGKIHTSIQGVDSDMPLKKEIDHLAHAVLLFIIGICVFLFIGGLMLGHPAKELVTTLTALFICVIPEGLPVVLTLALVTGTYRMAQRNVLIKRMQAVEALGRADVLIIDKTGTLTRNELMVSRIVTQQADYTVTGVGYFPEGAIVWQHGSSQTAADTGLNDMAKACALLATAQVTYDKKTGTFDVKGDPTNAALWIFAKKYGYTKEHLEHNYKAVFIIPFDAQWKYQAIFFEYQQKGIAYVIGSPEVLCVRAQHDPMCHMRSEEGLLAEGLRVVAVAKKEFAIDVFAVPEERQLAVGSALVASELTLLGFAGLADAIRPEVYQSIKDARESGIKVIMATGDHATTALLVAQKTGIYTGSDELITGAAFEALTPEQKTKHCLHGTVYARVTPAQKLLLIQELQAQGKLVGMTGDGVNDAPALVAADLGIAMGGIGTEVAKQAADIILLDDSFTNIVHAIEQGRHIFYTLRRVILYFFATNFGEILVVLFAMLANLPMPITAAQILWLNLVTDGFLDMALTMEPQEPGLLQRRWLARARLVDRGLVFKMFFMAIPMGIGSLYIFSRYYQSDLAYARTATLVTMALFQWFNAWNCRSETKSVFSLGFFSNRWLLLAIVVVLGLQVFLVYVPFMQVIFKTVPLRLYDWLLMGILSSTLFVCDEVRKWVVRHWWSEPGL